jgi:hypothetical protein
VLTCEFEVGAKCVIGRDLTGLKVVSGTNVELRLLTMKMVVKMVVRAKSRFAVIRSGLLGVSMWLLGF